MKTLVKPTVTERQAALLKNMIQGYTEVETAANMAVTVHAVRTWMRQLRDDLFSVSTPQMVSEAYRREFSSRIIANVLTKP